MYLYIYDNQQWKYRNMLAYLLSNKFKIDICYKSVQKYLKKWKALHVSSINFLIENNVNLTKYFKKNYPTIQLILYFPCNTHDNLIVDKIGNLDIKKIILIDDLHTKTTDYKLYNKYNKILITCSYKVKELRPELDTNKIISFPHYICDHTLIDSKSNENKINKILFCCSVSNSYPLRKKIRDSENLENLIDKLKNNFSSNSYYQIVNKYIATIATSGSIGYIVAKYFEIPSNQSLLLCNNDNIVEELENLGFYENKHYISINEDNFKEKFEYVLDIKNRKEINEIINNSYQLVKNKHKLTNRITQLHKICSNLLKL